MAKFAGKVGYRTTVDQGNGVHKPTITERLYMGDVVRNSRRFDNAEKVNDNISVGNSISIVADPYALNHFFAIQYVEWAGARWIVSNVDVQSPRLILTLGDVYNGAVPPPGSP